MRRINISGPHLRFAAAHFATSRGQRGEPYCEPIHGHNYAVAVQLDGDLTSDSWLFDFVELRRIVSALCQELDHVFLLPTHSPHLTAKRSHGHYEIGFASRRYVIPEAEVRALPIDNSTAERLAEWFAGRLASDLAARGTANISSLTVTVEEGPDQSASFYLPLDTKPPGNN